MKLSRKQIAILVLGSVGFGVSMAAREEVSGTALRAVVAGLGWFIFFAMIGMLTQSTARRA